MQFHRNEIFLLYNPDSNLGRQTKAMAKSLNRNIYEINSVKERLGPTYWNEIVNMLGMEPKQLLDRSNPEYQQKVAGKSLTMNGWLDVLIHNPHLVRAPIAIYNGKAVLCQLPTDIFKLNVANEHETGRSLPHLRHTF